MEIKILSPLTKVFPDEICGEYSVSEISLLKNEKTTFVVAVRPEFDDDVTVEISSDIGTKIYFERPVPVEMAAPKEHDDYFLRKAKSGMYPDCLEEKSVVKAKKDEFISFRVEILPNGNQSGTYPLKVTVKNGFLKASVNIKIIVENFALPKQRLICTNWFHTDCLSTEYNVSVFSDEYWRITENYMRCAAEHGINMILTPLFTPPLDTAVGKERPTVQLVDVKKYPNGKYKFSFDNLKKWIDTATGVGIEYFEMSHLFTQWGAKCAPKVMATVIADKKSGKRTEYKRIFGWDTKAKSKKYVDFLTQFSVALKRKLKVWDIEDRVFFHTSDEPGKKDYLNYRRNAKLMQKLFGEYRLVDALSDPLFYKKGLVKTPVPSIEHIQKFSGEIKKGLRTDGERSGLTRAGETAESEEGTRNRQACGLWTYYCCGPAEHDLPNRFIAMPLMRVRILGFILYKYDCEGFLHWGFNFWYTQLSKEKINPYETTDAGGKFSAGDAFVVYPKGDGTPECSLRLKVFYDAIEDYEALKCLEEKIGRAKTLEIVDDGLEKPLDEYNYPHSEKWITMKRRQINELLAK